MKPVRRIAGTFAASAEWIGLARLVVRGVYTGQALGDTVVPGGAVQAMDTHAQGDRSALGMFRFCVAQWMSEPVRSVSPSLNRSQALTWSFTTSGWNCASPRENGKDPGSSYRNERHQEGL